MQGKNFCPIFFFKRRTYSGAFETAAICLLSQKSYSGAFETAAKYRIKKSLWRCFWNCRYRIKRPIAALLNCHYSLFCFKKNPIVVVLKVPVYVIRTYCHTCCATLQSAGKKGACIGHFGLYQHFLGLSQRFKNSRIVPVFCSGCKW